MAESAVEEREGDEEMAACAEEEQGTGKENVSRKEKRKAMKKMKRKIMRKEIALKQREEEEARLNDPEEQLRLQVMEQEEAESMERERKEFEEREKAWIEAMKKKKEAEEEAHREEEEEEERGKALEASREHVENESKEDDDWEYIEEGQPEIIWKGNEIIFKKKKVKVPKRNGSLQNRKEGEERPTSNPLPPQSEAFADCTNASSLSSQQLLETVAQQVPNFGTEQDKAHCPFHLKTGTCRFGQHCSRVHFYPDKSCTLLMKNMYNGPGLACEQDEGLEYTDEEIERCYEEFYEDVHTEFLKFGEIVNFKVCRNSAFHLRGNVYVQYKLLDSALLAYNSVNGRYFAGKQVRCEFVNITRWKIAICGEYMKSGFKTCSRGTACNFIHCFHNPGRDYEWADSDRPPPRYWMKNMSALFGHSDDHENLAEQESLTLSADFERMSKADPYRHHSRSSRCYEVDSFSHDSNRRSRARDDRWQKKTHDEALKEKNHTKDNHRRKNRTFDNDFDEERLVEDRHQKRNCRHRRNSTDWSKDDKKRSCETDSDRDFSSRDKELLTHRTCARTSSRYLNGENSSRNYEAESEDSDGETRYKTKRCSSRHVNWEDKNAANEEKLQEINRDGSTRKRRGYSRRHSHRGKTGHDYDYETSESFEQEGDRMEEEQRECHDYRRRSKTRDRENGEDVNWSSELTDDNEDGHGHHRKQRKRSAPQNRESE